MVLLGHCKFVEKLKTKANEYNDTNVYVISEEFTSQICLNCKKRTKMCSELFECKFCNFSIDRDILGSINIFEKYYRSDTTNVDIRSSVTLTTESYHFRKVVNTL
jgi:transposase